METPAGTRLEPRLEPRLAPLSGTPRLVPVCSSSGAQTTFRTGVPNGEFHTGVKTGSRRRVPGRFQTCFPFVVRGSGGFQAGASRAPDGFQMGSDGSQTGVPNGFETGSRRVSDGFLLLFSRYSLSQAGFIGLQTGYSRFLCCPSVFRCSRWFQTSCNRFRMGFRWLPHVLRVATRFPGSCI